MQIKTMIDENELLLFIFSNTAGRNSLSLEMANHFLPQSFNDAPM